MSLFKLQIIAKFGIILSHLAKCPVPACNQRHKGYPTLHNNKGDQKYFLWVNIYHCPDLTFHLLQPQFIDQTLSDRKMGENVNPKLIPASYSEVLSRHPNYQYFDELFNYYYVMD